MATLIIDYLNLINNHWSIFMNKLISIYINNGVSLFEHGENTVIIPIELSNDIIDILEYLNFFILGGDLYKKIIINLNILMIIGIMKEIFKVIVL